MKEFLSFLEAAVLQLPGCLCAVQHNRRSQYIGANKNLRILDTTVNMGLCCKMYNTVNLILRKDLCDRCTVADICFYKCIIISILDIFQILKVSGIGQLINVDNANLIIIFFEHVMNVIRADKAGTTGHKIGSHFLISS